MKYKDKHPKSPKSSLRKKEAKREGEQWIGNDFLSVVPLVQAYAVAGYHTEGHPEQVTVVENVQACVVNQVDGYPVEGHSGKVSLVQAVHIEGHPAKVTVVELAQACTLAGDSPPEQVIVVELANDYPESARHIEGRIHREGYPDAAGLVGTEQAAACPCDNCVGDHWDINHCEDDHVDWNHGEGVHEDRNHFEGDSDHSEQEAALVLGQTEEVAHGHPAG